MSRLLSLLQTAIFAIVVIIASSGVVSAQQTSWNPIIGDDEVSIYDGDIVKVHRRRGHRHKRRGRGSAAALIGGLIIGGILADHAYRGRYRYYDNYNSTRNAHLRWCYNRYRSYRAWDNTFQPYYGPRRRCVSPYY